MQIIYDKHTLLPWISQRLNESLYPWNATAIGLLNDAGDIKTVVAYNMYDEFHRSIAMHIVSDTPLYLKPEYMREFFKYPFEQLKCARVTGLVPYTKPKIVRLNEKLGFKIEGVVRKGFHGEIDCIVMGMLKEECRWL